MTRNKPVLPDQAKAEVLNSWKEIASYMGRAVRTVQRYERTLHLPVRRISNKRRGAVIAFPQDLDIWLRSVSATQLPDGRIVPKPVTEGAQLRLQSSQLRVAHHEVVAKLMATLGNLYQLARVSVPEANDRRAA